MKTDTPNWFTNTRAEKYNYLSAASKLDETTAEDLTYVAFKQDFFTSDFIDGYTYQKCSAKVGKFSER